jgi:hypothetical protein
MLRRSLLLAVLLFCALAGAQTTVFNCSSNFVANSNGTCGVGLIGGSSTKFAISGAGTGNTPAVSSGNVVLASTGSGHMGVGMFWQSTVNVQAFSASWTFIPNLWNLDFVFQNNTVSTAVDTSPGPNYAAGAGCEAGFYQAFGTGNVPPNRVFGLQIDQLNYLNGSTFQNSNVQIYQQAESPCNPNDSQPNYYVTNKISTSPARGMNNPANTSYYPSPGVTLNCYQTSSTCDTYSATLTYDGSTLTFNLWDVTAGDSCPGSHCFAQSWANVNIPAMVNSNTAYVGLTNGSDGDPNSTIPLIITAFSYTVNSAPANPSLATYTTSSAMNSTTVVADPTASPAGGTYSGTQTVTLSDSTGSSYICYATCATGSGIMPYPDNAGNCQNGTKYTSAISISSTQNLCFVAGKPYTSSGGALPSDIIEASYTIGGSPQAATPTFSPGAGTYSSAQTVTISTSSSGAIICYNTTGSPATNGTTGCTTGTLYSGAVSVASSETLFAVAGGTGYSDSSVGSAAYTIGSATSGISIAGKATLSGKVNVQ